MVFGSVFSAKVAVPEVVHCPAPIEGVFAESAVSKVSHMARSVPASATSNESTVMVIVSVLIQTPFTIVHTNEYEPALFNPVIVVVSEFGLAITPPLRSVQRPTPNVVAFAAIVTVLP